MGGGRETPGVGVSDKEQDEEVPELGWCGWLLGRSKACPGAGGGRVIGMCSGSSFLSSFTLTGGKSRPVLDTGVVVRSDFLAWDKEVMEEEAAEEAGRLPSLWEWSLWRFCAVWAWERE